MTEHYIIADSSPLIALARINQLHLLAQLAQNVVIPSGVWYEVTIQGASLFGALEVMQATWIQVEPIEEQQIVSLRVSLGRGEAETIALAQTQPDSLLLLDDSRARRVAEGLGLRKIGTAGILRRAKIAGLVKQLRPLFDALKESGIYIHPTIIQAVLQDVGE